MRFLRRQIGEIASDDALKLYGGALALVNVIACIHWWLATPSLAQVLDPATTPVCWPFFETCRAWRVLSPAGIKTALLVIALAGIWNAYLFLLPRRAAAAYGLLMALTLVKVAIVAQDFRLTLNHHYMSACIAIVYLLLPDKRRAVTTLVVAMYCWAGLLKLDPQANWLSGAALQGARPFNMPVAVVPYACAYVVVLELVMVWGLLARRVQLRYAAIGQLALFHLSSYWVVGVYYPALMFVLLTIFPLTWSIPGPLVPSRSLARRPVLRRSTAAMLLIFSAAQLLRFTYPGDAALTGEGRMFALNMFDAAVECRALTTVHHGGGPPDVLPVRPPLVNARIHCDPLIYYELTRQFCLDARAGTDVDLTLDSRRIGDRTFRSLVRLESFCSMQPAYTIWRHNKWIGS